MCDDRLAPALASARVLEARHAELRRVCERIFPSYFTPSWTGWRPKNMADLVGRLDDLLVALSLQPGDRTVSWGGLIVERDPDDPRRAHVFFSAGDVEIER